jgi:hypothetical protein
MLDNVHTAFILIFISVLGLVAVSIALPLMLADIYDHEAERCIESRAYWKKIGRRAIIGLPFALLFLVATPTTKEAITIYLVPKIVESKAIKDIPPLFEEYIAKELQVKIGDLDKATKIVKK